MSHYSKGKGAQKSIYFSCWASFPSHALFRLRHGERGRAQNYFLCVLFADPTESASLCRRCAQLCRRRWLLCRRRSRLRDDWALNKIVELQGNTSFPLVRFLFIHYLHICMRVTTRANLSVSTKTKYR